MSGLERLTPTGRWGLLAAALMGPRPALFFEALRVRAELKGLLPELDALFGVPQLCDGPEPVDVGVHQLRLVNELARAQAPLAVRFAALMHKIGKGGTPREMLPSHHRHEQRGRALLDGLAQRIEVPDAALDLARLAIDECDRVHRVSDLRAGPIAALLERVQALARPERFEQLLCVCSFDYAVYPGHSAAEYPKAPRLRRALAAYAGADVAGLTPESALHARAQAIAHTLRGSASLS
ncbi:HD domain-containing protein [Methylibium sp.]|uniref:HD domain-containing protein n=1 Tax=Methylibium sp. TaxID=2067992 RepID=UPI003D0F38C6